jgi:hypothetical protein
MGIQGLGAIGEFISSLAIVVTLLVLIYEVRGAKNATLQANLQERQRKQEGFLTTMSQTPSLMASWAKANIHLGDSRWAEEGGEFGLHPDEWRQLSMHFTRIMVAWREAFDSDLPDLSRQSHHYERATAGGAREMFPPWSSFGPTCVPPGARVCLKPALQGH